MIRKNRIIEFILNAKEVILFIVFVGALIVGIHGFIFAELRCDEAIYKTLTMFFLNYSEAAPNIYINVARFLAAFFTIGGLTVLLFGGLQSLNYWIVGMLCGGVYIFGEGRAADELARSIGWKAIVNKKNIISAKNYVLMGNDKENFNFYNEHYDYLKKRKYILKVTL